MKLNWQKVFYQDTGLMVLFKGMKMADMTLHLQKVFNY